MKAGESFLSLSRYEGFGDSVSYRYVFKEDGTILLKGHTSGYWSGRDWEKEVTKADVYRNAMATVRALQEQQNEILEGLKKMEKGLDK